MENTFKARAILIAARTGAIFHAQLAMDYKKRTLSALQQTRGQTAQKYVLAGLDGFVDTIATPVGLRSGLGQAFTPITTIPEFGQRVLGAAGKSTNIELYPRFEKLGGNGPIMANALLAANWRLTYVGALGYPHVHALFQDMARRAEVISIAEPASTIAVEFDDGKLMLGQMRSLDDITLPRIRQAMGETAFTEKVATADLIALVNWTMIPNMTEIFRELVDTVLPSLPARHRAFFFDLADPEKRSRDDLLAALLLIGRFETFGRVTLGLNLKEACQVAAALDLPPVIDNEAGLRAAAAAIRESLQIATVVVHPRECAACATATGTAWVPGPYVEKPLITTGAGDHFNAGFCTGQLLGLSAEGCLTTGVCTSGHYVRTAASPTLNDLETFLANWS